MSSVDNIIEQYHNHGLHTERRLIDAHFVGTDAEDTVNVARAMRNIHILESISDEPITIYLNTEGGDEQCYQALIDTITGSMCEITIVGIGNVQSMGAVVLQAGDVRKMTEGALLMLHYGSMPLPDSSVELHQVNIDEFNRYSRYMEDILLSRIRKRIPKFSRAKLRNKLRTDWILTAAEALEYGLIDSIERKRK